MAKVGIIMGSRSDWDIMVEAANLLEEFGVVHEIEVVSAHRTPNRLDKYAKRALKGGIKVIIAGAGGAAHLPGMVASQTHLPVLGVPIGLKDLGGIDSLLSIMQMPGGVPVGTLAIGKAGAKNAALLAIEVLALNDKKLEKKLIEFRKKQTGSVPSTAHDGIKRIGILGGGQLGRMLIQAAHKMQDLFNCVVWEPSEDACAFKVADEEIKKPYDDKDALQEFINKVDKVILEFENIPVEIVQQIEASGKLVVPSSKVLSVVQDRIAEKTFFDDNKIPCAKWHAVNSKESALEAGEKLGYPFILKTTRFGYDGKGQAMCKSPDEAIRNWRKFNKEACIAEEFINFDSEISIIGARNGKGEMVFYDVAENDHEEGILHYSSVPTLLISSVAEEKAKEYSQKVIEKLGVVGLLALEMFVNGDVVYANEMAARPHNSGHWTMDGAKTCQFEQCIRAATGMPFGSCERTHDVTMRNLIGHDFEDANRGVLREPLELQEPFGYNWSKFHDYEKTKVRRDRKMGHINYIKEKEKYEWE